MKNPVVGSVIVERRHFRLAREQGLQDTLIGVTGSDRVYLSSTCVVALSGPISRRTGHGYIDIDILMDLDLDLDL